MTIWEIVAWVAIVLFLVVGIAGVILPGLPGPILFVAATLVHKFTFPGELSWWTVAFAVVGLLIHTAIDWVCMAASVKWTGASKWAIGGAMVGLLIGMLIPFPGLILGPMLGAAAAETWIAKKHWKPAAATGVAAGLSLIVSTALRLAVSVMVIVVFLGDCFLF